ncbi:hypothetical protein BOH72_09550 [Mycobacterium sp. WY10]|nr:hypothetical protein BOH72_09550 [Mycobacterium sp. WY10]
MVCDPPQFPCQLAIVFGHAPVSLGALEVIVLVRTGRCESFARVREPILTERRLIHAVCGFQLSLFHRRRFLRYHRVIMSTNRAR